MIVKKKTNGRKYTVYQIIQINDESRIYTYKKGDRVKVIGFQKDIQIIEK